MRNIVVIAIITTIIFSCSKEPVLDIREGMTFDPDTLMIDTSTKGWELYTWNSGEVWRYSLLPGTDNVKSKNEIYANPYIVNGREQFKLLVRALPSGEEIIWFGSEWANDNIEGTPLFFDMPALLTQYEIYSFSKRKAISLSIVP